MKEIIPKGFWEVKHFKENISYKYTYGTNVVYRELYSDGKLKIQQIFI